MFQRVKPQEHEGKKNDSSAFHKTCQGSRKYIHGEVCFVYNLYAIGWLERGFMLLDCFFFASRQCSRRADTQIIEPQLSLNHLP